jgi:hypothetical protein
VTALRLVLLYAFAQALHYAMWLALIPRLATPGRSLRQDLGTLPLLLAALATVAVPLFGVLGAGANAHDLPLSGAVSRVAVSVPCRRWVSAGRWKAR